MKNQIIEKDYKRALFEEETIIRKRRTIRSRLHNIYTEEQRKVALSTHDDKRFLIPNSTNTLRWGHYLKSKEEEEEIVKKTRKVS